MRVRVIVWREEDMYVVREVVTGVTSQGKTVDEALANLQEALELYFEEVSEALAPKTAGVLDYGDIYKNLFNLK